MFKALGETRVAHRPRRLDRFFTAQSGYSVRGTGPWTIDLYWHVSRCRQVRCLRSLTGQRWCPHSGHDRRAPDLRSTVTVIVLASVSMSTDL